VLYLVICINWMSCAVYITACPPLLISGIDHSAVLPSPMGHHCIKTSWLEDVLEANATLTELYSTSAYFAIVTFMGVGFGDFSAANFYEVRYRAACGQSYACFQTHASFHYRTQIRFCF